MSVKVRPGHRGWAPLQMAAHHVVLTEYTAVACKYAMRASALGGSYMWVCAVRQANMDVVVGGMMGGCVWWPWEISWKYVGRCIINAQEYDSW